MCLELIIWVQITCKGFILEKMDSPFPSSHSLPVRDHSRNEGTREENSIAQLSGMRERKEQRREFNWK